MSGPLRTADHFDAIAAHYDAEIPEHIRLHLLAKKTRAMHVHLGAHRTGLDCGCGTGHYLTEMSRLGYQMSGFEYSAGMCDQARDNNPALRAQITLGNMTEIAHPDDSFDFTYAINVLHHLPTAGAQITAVQEMLRITRPGGLVFVQDFDADNPLARVYMTYVFPLTSRIDDDEPELWVSPKAMAAHGFAQARVRAIERFTLLPNVMPRLGFGLATALETWAERRLCNRFGAIS